MKLAQIKKTRVTAKSLESKIAAERKPIEALEAQITKIFTSLASGKITQEVFLQMKGAVNDAIERKRLEIEKCTGQLHNLTVGLKQIVVLITETKKIAPIEIKSENYKFRSSLDKFKKKFSSKLSNSYILYTKDVMIKDNIIHLPIYMAMFL